MTAKWQYKYAYEGALITIGTLKAENAELRELVRDLRACNGSCPRCLELMGKCEYEGRMSELGIEVDG